MDPQPQGHRHGITSAAASCPTNSRAPGAPCSNIQGASDISDSGSERFGSRISIDGSTGFPRLLAILELRSSVRLWSDAVFTVEVKEVSRRLGDRAKPNLVADK